MRHVTLAMAMLAVVALAGSAAMAQGGPPAGGSQPGAGARGGAGPFAQLDLTADQKAKIETIMKAAREKASAAEAPEAKREIMKAAMEDVKKNVLTEEQRKKLASMPARRGFGVDLPLGQLDLTADQKAKIETIMKAAREKAAAAEGREAKMEIMKAAREDVVKNVLTEEQRKKLASLRDLAGERMVMRRLERVNLTAEQKGKVEEILKAAKASAEKADGPEAKGAVLRAAMEDIKKNVLTEEQRKKLESMPGRGGRGGRGGQDGAGSPPAPTVP